MEWLHGPSPTPPAAPSNAARESTGQKNERCQSNFEKSLSKKNKRNGGRGNGKENEAKEKQ